MKNLAPQIRNYDSLIEGLRKTLPQNPRCISAIGAINADGRKYRLVKILLGEGNAKKVLISAGIHGDEYAGIKAIDAFLEKQIYKEFDAEWEMTILPCLNPSGYEQNKRTNHEGHDLNRLFKSGSPPEEVALAQKVLRSRFDMTLDLHEDLDSPGLYVYMKGMPTTNEELGRTVIEAMKTFMPVNMEAEIEGNSAEYGLIALYGAIEITVDEFLALPF